MKKMMKGMFILCMILIVMIMVVPWMNNLTALLLQRTLEQTPLPEGTTLCDAVSAAGKLEGNGNGMQYFGAILLLSTLSLEELESYYVQYRKNDWSYIVEHQLYEDIPASGLGYLSFSFPDEDTISVNKNVNEKQYFIVYSWGDSDNPFHNLDLRAN